MFSLAKQVLKQQEELRILRQDTAFVLFLKPGQELTRPGWRRNRNGSWGSCHREWYWRRLSSKS